MIPTPAFLPVPLLAPHFPRPTLSTTSSTFAPLDLPFRRPPLSHRRPQPLRMLRSSDYAINWERPLGSGSFGDVFPGTELSTGLPVVVKRANSKPLSFTLLATEQHVNQKLAAHSPLTRIGNFLSSLASGLEDVSNNPSVLSYQSGSATTLLTKTHVTPQHASAKRWPTYLGTFEYCSRTALVWYKEGDGSTLEDYLSGRHLTALYGALGTAETHATLRVALFKKVVFELLAAVVELQSNGIMHRDIKPANCLVAPHDRLCPIKIIDFGSSCDWSTLLKRGLGTATCDPTYAPPEKRLSPLAPEKFDVYSVALVGLRVLVPSLSSETELRHFEDQLRNKFDNNLLAYLAWVDETGYDLGRELVAAYKSEDAVVQTITLMLAGMLSADVFNRLSAQKALEYPIFDS